MFYGSHVKEVEKLLDKFFDESLPKLHQRSVNSTLPPMFKHGIKDVTVSITVGPVALSFTLGGEDAPESE